MLVGFSPGMNESKKVKAFQQKIDPIQEGGHPIIAAFIERAKVFLNVFSERGQHSRIARCFCVLAKGGFQSPV